MNRTFLMSFFFATLLGILIGIVMTLQLQVDDPVLNKKASLSGMERLAAYQCLKAETKQIIMGGVEDNYATDNIESVPYGPIHDYLQNRSGKKGAVTTDRGYDDTGYDRFFLDSLDLPSHMAHGLFLIKTRSLSKTTNDTMNIGDMSVRFEKSNSHSLHIKDIGRSDIWAVDDDIYWANLADIKFRAPKLKEGKRRQQDYKNLADFIKMAPGDKRRVDVYIGDDHIIDFIGIAICQPPSEARGISLLVSPLKNTPNHIKMRCMKESFEDHCDPYKGDTLCSQSLPLACFKTGRDPLPDHLKSDILGLTWTGGEIKFTPPIRGDTFSNQNSVHQFCATTFDDNYRAATHQEGAGNIEYLAKSDNTQIRQAWVHAKTEPYGNCWDLTTTYSDQEK